LATCEEKIALRVTSPGEWPATVCISEVQAVRVGLLEHIMVDSISQFSRKI
jgi:hypothetical protein